jgi:predicted GTPase
MVEKKRKVIILGAAGRDFHNFNMFFKNNKKFKVVAFTASQIPFISNRSYPRSLAGRLYPKGIPIYLEKYLPKLVEKYGVDEVVLAYSDLSHEDVMHKASLALSLGVDFRLMGPESTMLKSKRFVIAVCAVRTGSGKSPTSRRVCQILKSLGKKYVVIRHPMPYGDLKKMAVQRFSSKLDLDRYDCTIEEREEYEPLIETGTVVYAGVDYEKILKEAEKESEVIVWDGGNNDLPFIKPDLHIVVADARRPGHEISYYPGETNVRMADVAIINKIDNANPIDIETVIRNVKNLNRKITIIRAAMPITVDRPGLIKGRRVLAIEDGPTMTHGGLSIGAASIAAKNLGAYLISPRSQAVGSIKDVYAEYPHLGTVLPAMGYSQKQIRELEETINKIDCDSVLIGTPVDIRNLLDINKPAAKVTYELREITRPNLEDIIKRHLRKL